MGAAIGIGFIVWIVICGLLYFVPMAIAIYREHSNMAAISVLNILLGWTVLGWIAALVWSVTSQEAQPVYRGPPPPTNSAPDPLITYACGHRGFASSKWCTTCSKEALPMVRPALATPPCGHQTVIGSKFCQVCGAAVPTA